MRKTTIMAAFLASITAGLFTTTAQAEPKKDTKDYGYTFTDDALLGTDMVGQGGIIKVRDKAVKDRLIRPRIQFVSEMLKSVENL
jgi:hypothetical protein